MEGEFVLSKDDQMNCYLMVGVAVRLALRMGLHRDSEKVAGKISSYQGELRRRIWNTIVQIDLLVSFHIGLPAMVQSIDSDTRFPRNLRDQDFDEDTIELPPSRPETETTSMSYTIAKGRICHEFGKVAEQANRLSLPRYDEVMSLDGLLNQAYAQVPPYFRIPPWTYLSPTLLRSLYRDSALRYSSTRLDVFSIANILPREIGLTSIHIPKRRRWMLQWSFSLSSRKFMMQFNQADHYRKTCGLSPHCLCMTSYWQQ
jgi:hypothetical protein